MAEETVNVKDVLEELDKAEKVDLNSVDMGLSPTIYAEVMGGVRYQFAGEFWKAKLTFDANKAVGNTQEANNWDKKMAALKMAVGIIDRDYPHAKSVMRRLMVAEEEKIANLKSK